MISRLFALGIVAAFATLAGCAQDDVDASSAKVKTADGAENDLSSQRIRVIGTIDSGDTKRSTYSPPVAPAYAFRASAGDTITIDVRSTVGDAIVLLTDDRFNSIAYNDDAKQTSYDARIVYTLPATTQTTSYRIVFADYDSHPAPFDVALSIKAGPGVSSGGPTCSYGDDIYHVGDHFRAGDGCNTCTCTATGIDCTKSICSCNPDSEPDKHYILTPQECQTSTWSCPAGQQKFQNECGCGCRRP